MANESMLKIDKLGGSDAAELRILIDRLGATADLRIERNSVVPARLGEPAAFVLIGLLGLTALKVIGAFLLKPRTRTTFVYTIDVVDADGGHRHESITLDEAMSDSIRADVLRALARIGRLPVEEIETAVEFAEDPGASG